MFKHGYKYRVKSYEELLKEKDITKDVMGTIFKKGGFMGFSKDADSFKNTLLNTRCVEGTQDFLLKKFKGEVSYEFFCESWMCECLGKIIEPLRKFEVGKTYTILSLEELLRVKDVILSKTVNGTDQIINEVIDGNCVINNKMFNDVFGKDLTIDEKTIVTKKRTIIFNEWEVSPWMCKEVVKEKKKKHYSLSEVIEQLSNNSNLTFVHPISQTELIKNIAGIEVINSKEVIFTEGWEKKQEPVTFQEAIKKGSKFRVKHEIIKYEYSTLPPQIGNGIMENSIERFLKKEYLNLNEIMLALAYRLSPHQLLKVIKEGEWFYE